MRLSVALCSHPSLDGTFRTILHFLAEYMNDKGYGARPGNERLMAVCGLTIRALQARLAKLIGFGLIERTECPKGGRGWASVYRICFENPHFPACPEKKKPRSPLMRGSGVEVEQTPQSETPQIVAAGLVEGTPQSVRETPQPSEETPQSIAAVHLQEHLPEQRESVQRTLSHEQSKEEERSTARRSAPVPSPPPSGKDSASRAGMAARQRQEELRLDTIVEFFERQYEKHTKVNAVVKDKDLAALKEMLRDHPKVPARRICAWMLEAFDLGKFPFEKGIVSLLNFTKRYRELDLTVSNEHEVMDMSLRGKRYADLTGQEMNECGRNLLVVMPADSPPDDSMLRDRFNGREMTFIEVFGEERQFFKPSY